MKIAKMRHGNTSSTAHIGAMLPLPGGHGKTIAAMATTA